MKGALPSLQTNERGRAGGKEEKLEERMRRQRAKKSKSIKSERDSNPVLVLHVDE